MALSAERKKQLEYGKQTARQTAAAKENAKAAITFTGKANNLTSVNKTGAAAAEKTASASGSSTKSALAWNPAPAPKSSSGSTKNSSAAKSGSTQKSTASAQSVSSVTNRNPFLLQGVKPTKTTYRGKNPFITTSPFEINRLGTALQKKQTPPAPQPRKQPRHSRRSRLSLLRFRFRNIPTRQLS